MSSPLREHFPIFSHHPNLVFLDSASTSQKPQKVIDAISGYLSTSYSNIHRGAYALSEISESLFEASKSTVAQFIHAASSSEIVYTSNATSAFNLLAGSILASGWLKAGDRIILSILEHHANIVPWQILATKLDIEIVFVRIQEDYSLDLEDLESKLTRNTRIVSITGASNVTGTIPEWTSISQIVREKQSAENPILLVMDASQFIPHEELDVQALDLDFAIFTGHKIFADTGIGVLYGKKPLLKRMTPSIGGGGAINFVHENEFEFAGLPFRFEPGTPNVCGAISLSTALEFIESIGGYPTIKKQETTLMEYMLAEFEKRKEFVTLYGPKTGLQRAGVFSFQIQGMHSGDAAEVFAEHDIAVRAGHHCAEPLHDFLGIHHSVRASISLYTQWEDIQKFWSILDSFKKLD